MTMVLTMNADSNSAGISISNSKKRVRKEEGNEFEMEFGVDGKGRKSFTPGWEKSLRVKDALPIKQNGKLIRVTRESVDNNANDEDGTDEEEGELEDDKGDKRIGKINSNDSDKAKEKQPKKKKIPVILNEKVFVEHTPLSETRIKKKIAAICMSITANPEDCFTKKGANDTDDKQKYKVSDLLSLMETTDASEFELVIMSALLVFRDIIPGYKIRMAENSSTAAAPLKKETKAMREFELSLLKAYEKFLYVLDQTVLDGLGNPKQPVDKWNLKAKLGLSALRCQCDLIKTVFHFNYRSTLLLSIVTRSAQSSKIIHSMCCDTITTLLKQDKVGDLSVEIVQMFSKVLVAMKHDVPASMLKCLTSVRLTVHADKAKSVRQKAKNERKKRKKADSDDVEVALLESSAVADKTAYQKYQADCLDEVLVIYFR